MLYRVGVVTVMLLGACASVPREARPPAAAEPLARGNGSAPVAQRKPQVPDAKVIELGTVVTFDRTSCSICTDDEWEPTWAYLIDAKRGETFTITASAQSHIGDGVKLVVYPLFIADRPLRYTFTADEDGLYVVDLTRSKQPGQIPLGTAFKVRLLVERGEGSPELQAQVPFSGTDDMTAEQYAALVPSTPTPEVDRILAHKSGTAWEPTPSTTSSSSSSSSGGGGMDAEVTAKTNQMGSESTPGYRHLSRIADVDKYHPFDIELTGGDIQDVRVAVITPTSIREPIANVSFVGCPAGSDDEIALKQVEKSGNVVVWVGLVADKQPTRKACVTVSSSGGVKQRVGVVVLWH